MLWLWLTILLILHSLLTAKSGTALAFLQLSVRETIVITTSHDCREEDHTCIHWMVVFDCLDRCPTSKNASLHWILISAPQHICEIESSFEHSQWELRSFCDTIQLGFPRHGEVFTSHLPCWKTVPKAWHLHQYHYLSDSCCTIRVMQQGHDALLSNHSHAHSLCTLELVMNY